MAPRSRPLSGRDVIRILEGFGFEIARTRGSHATLHRTGPDGRQAITVPLHRSLAPGTIRAVYRQASRFVSDPELKAKLFAD